MEAARNIQLPLTIEKRNVFRRLWKPYSKKDVEQAACFVSRLYGIKYEPKFLPEIKVSWLPRPTLFDATFLMVPYPLKVLAHMRSTWLAHYVRRWTDDYISVNAWGIPIDKKSANGPAYAAYLTHEIAHSLHFQEGGLSTDMYMPPALRCLVEGIATFAQYSGERGMDEPAQSGGRVSRFLKNFARTSFFVLTNPLRSLAMALRKALDACGAARMRAALADSSLFAFYVDPYNDGCRFVSHVARSTGSPAAAFSMLNANRPQTVEEILFPERYLERVRQECKKEADVANV